MNTGESAPTIEDATIARASRPFSMCHRRKIVRRKNGVAASESAKTPSASSDASRMRAFTLPASPRTAWTLSSFA